MLEQDSVVEMTRMRKVMDTGTLPSSQDMFRHFTKAHSRRFLPLARELEAAIQNYRSHRITRSKFLDPIMAKIISRHDLNSALHNIVNVRYRIQMHAYSILRQEYRITIPRPSRLPEAREEERQRQSEREWRVGNKSRHL